MLFNSPLLIFMFLPATLLVFFWTARLLGREAAIISLVLASLLFYGWWNPIYLILISISVFVNFGLGYWLPKVSSAPSKQWLLFLGIVFNLGLLGYFKYANFFVNSLNAAVGTAIDLAPIVLPLAISFFTFQQIAYLVDAYKDKTHEYNFFHYCLFVVFFPQLIAGPIVHHKDILSQFSENTFAPRIENFVVGISIFLLGLAKKVLLADNLAVYSTPMFAAADAGNAVSFIQAWVGLLAYTFQLYFDFSGYSDMAIGLARLFGIKLPLNFNSPYKATSTIDLWQRWHMTLTRFLRDYVFVPLGGNSRNGYRRFFSVFMTMVIGGLWHGAGYTFLFWGVFQGGLLLINHMWRKLYRSLGYPLGRNRWYTRFVAGFLTFSGFTASVVLFRSGSFASAKLIYLAIAGTGGVVLPASWLDLSGGGAALAAGLGIIADPEISVVGGGRALLWVAIAALIAFLMPNVQEIMVASKPALIGTSGKVKQPRFTVMRWEPSVRWALTVGIITAFTFGSLASVSEFLYFQF